MLGHDPTLKETARATHDVALAVMRVGFGLMAAAAASDFLFAVLARAGITTSLLGALFTGCALFGLLRPERAASLLRPKGHALLPAVLFAAVGAVDPAVQVHYAEVAPAIVWIVVITSSTGFVALCVAVSAAGYIAGLEIQGHPLRWLVDGPGRDLVANQVVDLAANAGVMLLMLAVLRWFVRGAPQRITDVRSGGPSLTPQLALAAREPVRTLRRADSRALVAGLTPAEQKVLALLIDGRTPKEIAEELVVVLATVRTHIAAAKRKTGARTLDQLAAIFAESCLDE